MSQAFETIYRHLTIIETAELNVLESQAYPADVRDRIHDRKINRLEELLPRNWESLVVAHPEDAWLPASPMPT